MNAHATSPARIDKKQKVIALVLAGLRSALDPVAKAGGKSIKAFVEVQGIPMIERVVAAIQETGRCDGIVICLPDHLPVQEESPRLFEWLKEGRITSISPDISPAQSVLQAISNIEQDAVILVTTGDHPLLSPKSIHELLDAFEEDGSDVAAGIVNTSAIRQSYPGIKRTAIRFLDGPVTGCNLFALRGEGGAAVVRFWTRMEANRKRPVRMASALGIGTTILYAFGLLTLDVALKRLGTKLGARLRAVRLADLHAGIDVDTPEDLRLVREIFARRE